MGWLDIVGVPNAPCGVESWNYGHLKVLKVMLVPNAPCGVERWAGNQSAKSGLHSFVPNAPCGVESQRQSWVFLKKL